MTEEPKKVDNSRSHPLKRSKSALESFIEKMNLHKEKDEFKLGQIEEWEDCVNRLANIPDGKFFLQTMIRHAGFLDAQNTANTVKMVENAGKSAFYLTYVRPFLEEKLRKDIE